MKINKKKKLFLCLKYKSYSVHLQQLKKNLNSINCTNLPRCLEIHMKIITVFIENSECQEYKSFHRLTIVLKYDIMMYTALLGI